MPRAISRDLRERIVSGHKEGLTYTELSNRLSLGEATISRVLRRFRETGDVDPRPHAGGYPNNIPDSQLPAVQELVDQYPDATLAELAVLITEEFGRSVSRASVGSMLVRFQLLAQEKGLVASESSRPSVQVRPEEFLEELRGVAPEKLVFLDEAGSHKAMTRVTDQRHRGEVRSLV